MTKLCDTCEYLRYCARSGIEEAYYDGLDEKLPLKHNCKHFMKWLKEKHE